MSISGSLEDVSVADVMQFIHLGRRTGALLLERGDERARVGFRAGKLVSASGPDPARLGDLLLAAGLIDDVALQAAAALQGAGDTRNLGQILVAGGQLAGDDLRAVVVLQIERTVAEVVGWDRGSFRFAVGEQPPADDPGLYPGELVPDADINTQLILLEAARIFDERHRSDGDPLSAAGPQAPPEPPPPTGVSANGHPPRAAVAPAAAAEETPTVVWVESADGGLLASVAAAAPRLGARVEPLDLGRLGEAVAAEPSIAVVDLRAGGPGLEDLARFHRSHPLVSTVALVAADGSFAAAYEAGAVAVVPSVEAVATCLDNLIASRRPEERRSTDRRVGVARLRRILGELRAGFISATAALSLMHIISESVERAVLFLARGSFFSALGAFGSALDGRPLAELTRGLRIELEADHALGRCYTAGEALAVGFDEAGLPPSLARAIGRPRSGQAVLFPVPGVRRVIAVVYADNGDQPQPVEDIDILEIATAQVGMAFENELLRRQSA